MRICALVVALLAFVSTAQAGVPNPANVSSPMAAGSCARASDVSSIAASATPGCQMVIATTTGSGGASLVGGHWSSFRTGGTIETLTYGSSAPNSIGGFFVPVSSCTPDFGTCFQDADNGYWQRNILEPGVYRLSWFDTLAHANTSAATATLPLVVDVAATLPNNTTITAPILRAGGGVIHMNGHNLTTNALDGPDIQMIDPGAWGAAGSLSVRAGSVLRLPWLTGPYGNSSVDYAPGFQQLFNVCMRPYNSQLTGPRILDVSAPADVGFSLADSKPSIFFNETVSAPQGADDCEVRDSGTGWQMNSDNTQFFTFCACSGAANPETAFWRWLGNGATFYQWENAQTTSDPNSVFFSFTSNTSSAQGHHHIVIDGIHPNNGYGFMTTAIGSNTGLNGWWASHVNNIIDQGLVGPLVYHVPAAGASERQEYNEIMVNNKFSCGTPKINIADAPGLEMDQVSIDNVGSAANACGTFATSELAQFNSDGPATFKQWHLEQDSMDANTGIGFVNFCDGIYVVSGIYTLSVWNKSGDNNTIFRAQCANTKVSIDNVYATITNSPAGNLSIVSANASTGAPDPTTTVEIGPTTYVNSGFHGITCGRFCGGEESQFVFKSAWNPAFYGNNIDADTNETQLIAVNDSDLPGATIPSQGQMSSIPYQLGQAITNGTATLRFYDNGTLVFTTTLTSASAVREELTGPCVACNGLPGGAAPVQAGDQFTATIQVTAGFTPSAEHIQILPVITRQ